MLENFTNSRPYLSQNRAPKRSLAFSALLWSFVEQVCMASVAIVVYLSLTRMLTPSDFGVVGLVAVFSQVSRSLTTGGLMGALIRKESPTSSDYSTVFVANVVVAVLIYVALFLCTPAIAEYYKEPRLHYLVPLIGLSFVFEAFGMVQHTKLTKALDFRRRAFVVIPSVFFAGIVSVVAAYQGAGAISIAIFLVVDPLLQTVILWCFAPWRPSSSPSWSAWRDLGAIGGVFVGRNLAAQVVDGLPALMIGRVFGTTALGYYSNAMKANRLSLRFVTQAVSRPLFPMVSALQGDKVRLRKMISLGVEVLTFVTFPISAVMLIESHDFVQYILGERWLAAAPYLQVFAVGGFLRPLLMFNDGLLKVFASPKTLTLWTVGRQTFTVALMLFAIQYSPLTLAISVVVANAVTTVVGMIWTRHVIQYNFLDQLRSVSLSVKLSSLVAIVMILMEKLQCSGILLDFVVPVFLSVLIYLGMAKLVDAKPLKELTQLVNKLGIATSRKYSSGKSR